MAGGFPLRLVAALALTVPCLGCAGVPAATIWVTVGAGLGATAAVATLDDDILRILTRPERPAPPPAP